MFSYSLGQDAYLRLLTAQDAEECFAVVDANRAHLREWLPWVDRSNSPTDTYWFIEGALQQFAANNGFQAGIVVEQRLVGAIGFHGIDWASRRTSIGYWLAEPHQGRGLVTTACRALVDHAFSAWKLNRVEVRAAVDNLRSRAVPERLGFTLEGTIRQAEWVNDRFVDHAVYGMLAADWGGTATLT